MSTKHRALITAIITATTCWIALPAGVIAQNTLDRFLSSVDVSSAGKCNRIDIRFNRPATYAGHSPADSGAELVIRLAPLGTEQTPDKTKIPVREAATATPGNAANLEGVSFDATTSGVPVVRLSFSHAVSYRVVMDSESRHLRVDESENANAAGCLGKAASIEGQGDTTTKSDLQAAGADPIAEGKKALAAKDFARAIGYFTKATTDGNAAAKQTGQEFLGLAQEKAGHMAHAKAEYETYLKLYPRGEGATRVRQRLAGVVAAEDDAAEAKFAERGKTNLGSTATGQASPIPLPKGSTLTSNGSAKGDLSGSAGNQQLVSNERAKGSKGNTVADPNAWTWDKNGSLSQYYYRDDNFSSSDILRGSLGTHETLQNEMISSGDFYLHGENQIFDTAIRGSLFNEHGFGLQKDTRNTNVSTIYMEGKHKPSGIFARIGRQSRSSGGVFGRFDGANLGIEVNKDLKLQTVVGSPVFSRDAKPFADGRFFYGASIDYTFPNQEWATALYAIEQDIHSVVDRRAIGAELRYTGKNKSVYSAIDYDVYYGEINNAYVSGNWNFKEGASLYATVDYRHVPFLLTSNALMGQSTQKLTSLVDIFGEDEVYQLALDRTAYSKSASVGLSYPLTDKWTASLDGTVADYSGTPASPISGIDAVPNPGIEVYLSSQLSGTSIFRENDSMGLGLRYSTNDSSSVYMADASYRYPVSEKLRLSSRLRLSFRDGKKADSQQYLVMPTVGLRYRINRNWNFEVEAGARWEDNKAAAGNSQNVELLINAGYRYEF